MNRSMDKTYNIPDNDNNIVAESDVAYAPAKNMPLHLDITLDENAIITDIKKAIQMIKGIVSVKIKSDNDVNNNVIKKSLVGKTTTTRKDDTLMTKEEFLAKLARGEEEYRQGKCTRLMPNESVTEMLRRSGYNV